LVLVLWLWKASQSKALADNPDKQAQ